MSSSLLLFLVSTSSIAVVSAESQNPSASKTTCHECIPTCAWCHDPTNCEVPGCYQPSISDNSRCRENFTWNPRNAHELGSSDVVQISPQRVSLKLRVNEVHVIRFNYATAENHRGDDATTGAVHITYKSSCLDGGPSCGGLKVIIDVTQCPVNPDGWRQTIQNYPADIPESLIVEMECECPCERPEHVKVRARECSDAGMYKCGMCECVSHHAGHPPGSCRPDNTSATVCSRRGACICGECDCFQRDNPAEVISGRYCECDNFSCDRRNGQLCFEHGECVCGTCKCDAGWTGMACDCRASYDTCVPFGGGSVCSGKGDCICGDCRCHEGRYSGRFCEHASESEVCLQLKDCVRCQVYQTGPLDEEECANCTFVPWVLESVQADEEDGEILCLDLDESGCRFSYVYSYDDDTHVIVWAQEKMDCPPDISQINWFKDIILYFLGINWFFNY